MVVSWPVVVAVCVVFLALLLMREFRRALVLVVLSAVAIVLLPFVWVLVQLTALLVYVRHGVFIRSTKDPRYQAYKRQIYDAQHDLKRGLLGGGLVLMLCVCVFVALTGGGFPW